MIAIGTKLVCVDDALVNHSFTHPNGPLVTGHVYTVSKLIIGEHGLSVRVDEKPTFTPHGYEGSWRIKRFRLLEVEEMRAEIVELRAELERLRPQYRQLTADELLLPDDQCRPLGFNNSWGQVHHVHLTAVGRTPRMFLNYVFRRRTYNDPPLPEPAQVTVPEEEEV